MSERPAQRNKVILYRGQDNYLILAGCVIKNSAFKTKAGKDALHLTIADYRSGESMDAVAMDEKIMKRINAMQQSVNVPMVLGGKLNSKETGIVISDMLAYSGTIVSPLMKTKAGAQLTVVMGKPTNKTKEGTASNGTAWFRFTVPLTNPKDFKLPVNERSTIWWSCTFFDKGLDFIKNVAAQRNPVAFVCAESDFKPHPDSVFSNGYRLVSLAPVEKNLAEDFDEEVDTEEDASPFDSSDDDIISAEDDDLPF